MSTLTSIESCQTTACSFNEGGCTAPAISVAGSGQASCTTFVELDARGGLPTADGRVGTCSHLECTHNSDLMCQAPAVQVGDNGACLTYARA
ncbi:DUF1540 domain-containing protein [Mariniluteicoccus flavus]